MKSKLFIPGHRSEFFGKAAKSAASALSFDLEDSVPPHLKREARQAIADWFHRSFVDTDSHAQKTYIVRTNSVDSEYFSADLDAVCIAGLDIINLPKVETVEQIHQAEQRLAALEEARKLPRKAGLLLNIESVHGLCRVAQLATASPRICGLQLGLGDLFEPLGIDRSNPHALAQTMLTVRWAAGLANLPTYDAAYPHFKDVGGFRREADLARSLGYAGKSCIHPDQIPLANEIFQPSALEVKRARQIVEAAMREDQHAAFSVDGSMIDPPFLERARLTLRQAEETTVSELSVHPTRIP